MGMTITRIIATSLLGAAFSGPASAAAGDGSALDKCVRGQRYQDAAIEHCTQALEGRTLKPGERALAYLSRGLGLSRRGRTLEAIEDFTRAIAEDPLLQPAWGARASARLRLGAASEAVADYDQAIRLDSQDARALHNRAVALRSLGQTERAIVDYGEAIRLDPYNAESFLGRGVAWQAVEEHRRAVGDFNAALRIAPRLASAYSNRGVSYRAMGLDERAVDDFEAALRINPGYVQALVNRGAMRRARGEMAAALADFDRAVTLNPAFADAFFNRGLLHFSERRYRQAGVDFARAAAMGAGRMALLWQYLAHSRATGTKAEDTLLATPTKEVTWPAQIAAYLAGRSSQSDLFERAQRGTDYQRRAQRCEALFYVAEGKLLQQDPSEAARLFGSAIEVCPKDFLEYELAAVELSHLAVPAPGDFDQRGGK